MSKEKFNFEQANDYIKGKVSSFYFEKEDDTNFLLVIKGGAKFRMSGINKEWVDKMIAKENE